MTKHDIDLVVGGYQSGEAVDRLATRFAVAPSTVYDHLKRAGVATDRRNKLSGERLDEAVRLHESGLTMMQIGKHFGVHAETVRLALRPTSR